MMNLLMAIALAAGSVPTVAEVKAAVKAELKDPQSAQFRGLKPLKDDEGKVYGYCGWVNAKNSYGGYVGESFFLYNHRKRVVALVPSGLTTPDMC